MWRLTKEDMRVQSSARDLDGNKDIRAQKEIQETRWRKKEGNILKNTGMIPTRTFLGTLPNFHRLQNSNWNLKLKLDVFQKCSVAALS